MLLVHGSITCSELLPFRVPTEKYSLLHRDLHPCISIFQMSPIGGARSRNTVLLGGKVLHGQWEGRILKKMRSAWRNSCASRILRLRIYNPHQFSRTCKVPNQRTHRNCWPHLVSELDKKLQTKSPVVCKHVLSAICVAVLRVRLDGNTELLP